MIDQRGNYLRAHMEVYGHLPGEAYLRQYIARLEGVIARRLGVTAFPTPPDPDFRGDRDKVVDGLREDNERQAVLITDLQEANRNLTLRAERAEAQARAFKRRLEAKILVSIEHAEKGVT